MYICIPAEKFHSVALKLLKSSNISTIFRHKSFVITSQCAKNTKLSLAEHFAFKVCYDATLLICLEGEQLSRVAIDHCFSIFIYLDREKFRMGTHTIDNALHEKVV